MKQYRKRNIVYKSVADFREEWFQVWYSEQDYDYEKPNTEAVLALNTINSKIDALLNVKNKHKYVRAFCKAVLTEDLELDQFKIIIKEEKKEKVNV